MRTASGGARCGGGGGSRAAAACRVHSWQASRLQSAQLLGSPVAAALASTALTCLPALLSVGCLPQMEAERQQKIRQEVKQELRVFYCEVCCAWDASAAFLLSPACMRWHCAAHPAAPGPRAPLHACKRPCLPPSPLQWCHKQYQAAHEMEEHLSSYDHHHRKRLAGALAGLPAVLLLGRCLRCLAAACAGALLPLGACCCRLREGGCRCRRGRRSLTVGLGCPAPPLSPPACPQRCAR